jgi:MSHA pilin protein MshD
MVLVTLRLLSLVVFLAILRMVSVSQRVPGAFAFPLLVLLTMAIVFSSRGATLVEMIIAIAILAIAIVPLSMTLSYTASHSADSMIEVKVVELGEAYVEEILSKRYDDNTAQGGSPPCALSGTACGALGPEAGETRVAYDDVDDYDGTADQPPLDSLGISRVGYERYLVEVEVTYATASEIVNYGLDGASDAKRILVRVSPPSGTPIEFDVYRGNF